MAKVIEKGLTPEQVTHLTNLHLFVEDAVMPQAIEDFENHGLEGDAFIRRVQKLNDFLDRTSMSAQNQAAIKSQVQDYLHDADAPVEHHVNIIRSAAVCISRALTAAWVGALTKGTSVSPAGQWLRLDALDDSLLPRGIPEATRYFEAALKAIGDDTVTSEEGREMLVAVRRKAKGDLPDALIRYLDCCGVMIVR